MVPVAVTGWGYYNSRIDTCLKQPHQFCLVNLIHILSNVTAENTQVTMQTQPDCCHPLTVGNKIRIGDTKYMLDHSQE